MAITTVGIVFWLLGAVWAASALDTSYQQHVHSECTLTRYPSLCINTLSTAPKTEDIMSALIEKTISETKMPNSGISAQSTSAHAATLGNIPT